MWPLLGSVAGSILTGLFNQNSANQQMAFQKDMRSTQYQTATEDMKKAGLNPMLAFSQGGAGTPSGASAQMPDMGDSVSHGVSSAIQAAMMKSQMENVQADTQLKADSSKAAVAGAAASMANAALASQNSATVAAMRPLQVAGTVIDNMTKTNANMTAWALGKKSEVEGDYFSSPAGRLAHMISMGGADAAGATSALKNFDLGKIISSLMENFR